MKNAGREGNAEPGQEGSGGREGKNAGREGSTGREGSAGREGNAGREGTIDTEETKFSALDMEVARVGIGARLFPKVWVSRASASTTSMRISGWKWLRGSRFRQVLALIMLIVIAGSICGGVITAVMRNRSCSSTKENDVVIGPTSGTSEPETPHVSDGTTSTSAVEPLMCPGGGGGLPAVPLPTVSPPNRNPGFLEGSGNTGSGMGAVGGVGGSARPGGVGAAGRGLGEVGGSAKTGGVGGSGGAGEVGGSAKPAGVGGSEGKAGPGPGAPFPVSSPLPNADGDDPLSPAPVAANEVSCEGMGLCSDKKKRCTRS